MTEKRPMAHGYRYIRELLKNNVPADRTFSLRETRRERMRSALDHGRLSAVET